MTELDRRTLLAGGGLGMAAAALASTSHVDAAVTAPGRSAIRIGGRTIHVVDLTHQLTSDFNVIPGRPRIAMDPIVGSGYDAGMNLNRLMLVEHTGTHIDAPRHFDNAGRSVGEIPIGDLIVPLALFGGAHVRAAGEQRAAVADRDRLAEVRRVLPVADDGREVLRRPAGFSLEVCEMLIAERDVKGIALDAGSIDRSSDVPCYPVHRRWLRSGRWALEILTNLGEVPPSGAVLIVGAPPIKDATGIPIRAIALF